MAALLKFPDTALYEDERTTVALKLMTYLESSGHVRKEMYTRYVQYLVDLHAGLKNYVEAGVTQMYQIRALEFSDEILSKTHVYPEEKERDRREKLYRSAIEYFKQGEDCMRLPLVIALSFITLTCGVDNNNNRGACNRAM
jgi:hypothetical protein